MMLTPCGRTRSQWHSLHEIMSLEVELTFIGVTLLMFRTRVTVLDVTDFL